MTERASRRASAKLRLEHVERLDAYVAAVTSGSRPACRNEQQAIARHLKDIERARSDEFPFYFDEREVEIRCRRAEFWEHQKGRWSKRRERIKLEGWQCFALGSIFGWKRTRDGLRRFREAFLLIPRKNGKSPLAAIIGIEFFAFDGEGGAEVYCGATNETQAWEVFRPARHYLETAPDVLDEMGIEVNARTIVRPDGSRFTTVIGNPGEGAAPSLHICDEYHEHVTNDQVDTMVTGMVGREQPLLLMISTAGDNTAGPCYAKVRECEEILEGRVIDETVFALIYGVDESDDWADPQVLVKANPNLGVSIEVDTLLQMQRNAVRNPIAQSRFKTRHLNVWVTALTGIVNVQTWRACADHGLTAEELIGEDCWMSVDLASKSDLCARVLLFRKYLDGAPKPHYYAFLRCYLPELAYDETKENRAIYARARRDGDLVVTPGATIDVELMLADIDEDAREFNPTEFVFDPFNATHLAQRVAGAGIEVVEFPQTINNMAPATDDLLTAIKDGRFHHNGSAFFEWQAANARGKSGRKGLVVPVKEKAHQKIDGFVGLCIAFGRASAESEELVTSGGLTVA